MYLEFYILLSLIIFLFLDGFLIRNRLVSFYCASLPLAVASTFLNLDLYLWLGAILFYLVISIADSVHIRKRIQEGMTYLVTLSILMTVLLYNRVELYIVGINLLFFIHWIEIDRLRINKGLINVVLFAICSVLLVGSTYVSTPYMGGAIIVLLALLFTYLYPRVTHRDSIMNRLILELCMPILFILLLRELKALVIIELSLPIYLVLIVGIISKIFIEQLTEQRRLHCFSIVRLNIFIAILSVVTVGELEIGFVMGFLAFNSIFSIISSLSQPISQWRDINGIVLSGSVLLITLFYGENSLLNLMGKFDLPTIICLSFLVVSPLAVYINNLRGEDAKV